MVQSDAMCPMNSHVRTGYRWNGNGSNDYSGDGGAATNASLSDPSAIALDAAGNLFISDSGNQRIRKVGTDGIITTLAGNGGSPKPDTSSVEGLQRTLLEAESIAYSNNISGLYHRTVSQTRHC